MSLNDQVLAYIKHPDPAAFERLALAVFACQFATLEPYRRFCASRGVAPDNVRSVAEVPPVSTAGFKYVEFCATEPERIFLTSGTTRGRDHRGQHFIADLRLYHASAIKHLERMLFADRCHPSMLALHPTADRMPESSLSQMISWCIETFGGARALCCATPSQVDTAAAYDFLRSAEAGAEPVCILGTTAALSALFEYLRSRDAALRLPARSRLMDTGGAKGQATPMLPGAVLEMSQRYLAIKPECVINEYGMTELCSQLYDATSWNCPGLAGDGERVKVAPPWLRVIVRDPASLRPLRAGRVGLLSFFDLANVSSVSALLTEDLGAVNADGTVRILGRLLDSDPRGCALGIEQFARAGAAHPLPLKNLEVPRPAVDLSLNPESLNQAALRMRALTRERLAPERVAASIAQACDRFRDPAFAGRAAAIDAAFASSGQTPALLGASLDALLANFTRDAMLDLVRRVVPCRDLIGFVMPGNVMGAGLHEMAAALVSGAPVIIKASVNEPLFFAGFHRALCSIDPAAAARVQVMLWDRFDRQSTAAMAQACDRIVVFGDDDTIAALAAIAGPKLVDFGARLSGALLSREAVTQADAKAVAAAVARDVSLFDQRGCLSLHHVFVETRHAGDAHGFAVSLALEMDALARSLPPAANPPLAETSAARAARENARWRRMGGAAVDLWEGEDLAWTVIYDPGADFQPSPLCRTVRVSTFVNQAELRDRLAAAAGALEGFALADPANRLDRSLLGEMGVSYICAPGQLQSPPPSWAHGGGRFLRCLGIIDE